MTYKTKERLLMAGVILFFSAIAFGIFMLFRAMYLDGKEAQEYRKSCEVHCAPFAYRTHYGCECRDENNHWVPQESF